MKGMQKKKIRESVFNTSMHKWTNVCFKSWETNETSHSHFFERVN